MSSPQDDFSSIEPDNLYAILNIQHDATEEEIKTAYKRLVLLFHPDKFTDVGLKEAAQSKFIAIQKAHDVLTDSRTRTLYDSYGLEGLNWEVGTKFKSKEEIRAEYDLYARLRKMEEEAELISADGELLLAIDATPLFSRSRIIASPMGIVQGRLKDKGIMGILARYGEVSFTQVSLA
jgi:DnaJ family protein C protein 11